MKKAFLFDLDGVLVDSKEIHFHALNIALSKIDSRYVISQQDHKNIYDGLSTRVKLDMLSKNLGLDRSYHEEVWKEKQKETEKLFKNISHDNDLVEIFSYIKSKGIFIGVVSNSIKKTISECLNSLGVKEFVDLIISNEDVQNPKPHPEMYWKAMSFFSIVPEQAVIFEDSAIGLIAAYSSGSNVVEINNRADLNYDKIDKALNILLKSKSSWGGKKMNVLIPMAGAGSRFSDAGYTFPKPLIDVNGIPMIEAVVNNLSIDATYTYIVQKEHYEKYSLFYFLNQITPNCNIVQVDGITEGAAATCLLAKKFIDNDEPLIIANSDQIIEWSSRDFLYEMYTKNADAGIVVFNSIHPKWSYAKVDDNGLVIEVAEKKPISENATAGIYYWKNGSDFIKYAESMINKNIRVNNEFYVCPVFNEAIIDNKKIYTVKAEKMWGIGTPEDLLTYTRSNND